MIPEIISKITYFSPQFPTFIKYFLLISSKPYVKYFISLINNILWKQEKVGDYFTKVHTSASDGQEVVRRNGMPGNAFMPRQPF